MSAAFLKDICIVCDDDMTICEMTSVYELKARLCMCHQVKGELRGDGVMPLLYIMAT